MKTNIEVGKTYVGIVNGCEFTVLNKKNYRDFNPHIHLNENFCTIQIKGEEKTREHAESFLEHLLIKEKQ